MNIGHNWRITSDAMNITLLRRTVPKGGKNKGKVNWVPIGHYSRVGSALKGLVDLEVALTDLKDLKTVVAKQDELYKLIEEIK